MADQPTEQEMQVMFDRANEYVETLLIRLAYAHIREDNEESGRVAELAADHFNKMDKRSAASMYFVALQRGADLLQSTIEREDPELYNTIKNNEN